MVVPCLNEAAALAATVESVFVGAKLCGEAAGTRRTALPRVAIADGGSTDRSLDVIAELCEHHGAAQVLKVTCTPHSRGRQLNAGSAALLEDGRDRSSDTLAAAEPTILLFLHADTHLPHAWDAAIVDAFARHEASSSRDLPFLGCFTLALPAPTGPRLRLMLSVANMRARWGGLPYGDQAYFVRQKDWLGVGRFSDVPIMEDVDLLYKLRRAGRETQNKDKNGCTPSRDSSQGSQRRQRRMPTCASQLMAGASRFVSAISSFATPALYIDVLALPVETSARRWTANGVWRNTARNQAYMAAWHAGVSPETIYYWYYGRRASGTYIRKEK